MESEVDKKRMIFAGLLSIEWFAKFDLRTWSLIYLIQNCVKFKFSIGSIVSVSTKWSNAR